MINAIVSDIDGVIVGNKNSKNFPVPNKKIINILSVVRKNGIPVVLCTSRYYRGADQIAVAACLDNPFIGDGGAIILNPVRNQIITEHTMSEDTAQRIITIALANNLYVEVYTEADYFVQEDQKCYLTDLHAQAMQRLPCLVRSLLKEIVDTKKILKIILVTRDTSRMGELEGLFESVKNVNRIWTIHPSMLPAQFSIFTAQGVSKQSAVKDVLEKLNINFNHVLGIGDTESDWVYMQDCGYVGVVGENRSLRELAKKKGRKHYFAGRSVDENGILDIFEFYELYP